MNALSLLPHLLPPNATPLEKAVIQALLKQLNKVPPNVKRSLWNAQTCPVELLPWLAWTFGLETWDNNWPASVKRARIGRAISVARIRGTLASLEDVLQSYGGNFIIKEWWEYEPAREPHTFDITLNLTGEDGEAATAEFIESVIDDINRTKPVRSHYTVTQGLTVSGSLAIVAAGRSIVSTRLVMDAD